MCFVSFERLNFLCQRGLFTFAAVWHRFGLDVKSSYYSDEVRFNFPKEKEIKIEFSEEFPVLLNGPLLLGCAK